VNRVASSNSVHDRLRAVGFESGRALPLLIGGEWRRGGGMALEITSPIDGSHLADLGMADASDVRATAEAAERAFDSGVWSRQPTQARAGVLRSIADANERDAERLAVIQTADNGKLLTESRSQVSAAAGIFRYYAAVIETQDGRVAAERGDYFAYVVHEPIGVVAAITPWNSPLTLEAQKIAPALAAGNSVILKPSEVCPLISLEYARVAMEAGVPPGVLSVVNGTAAVTGTPLVADPAIKMVSFTGGVAAGRVIARTAGERLIPAVLELGGKSPNIVFADADLDAAIGGALYAIFSNSGQSCIAGSRLLVEAPIAGPFIHELIDRTRDLRLGDPFDPAIQIAPLASHTHRDRVAERVDSAVADGAELLAGGGTPGGPLADGAYFEPTLLRVDDGRSPVARDEVFGPVAVIQTFSGEAQALAIGNDTDFGLACGVWTSDAQRARRVARGLSSGMAWINTYKITPPNMPFGGYKQSGFGRESGPEGLTHYQQIKSVYEADASLFQYGRGATGSHKRSDPDYTETLKGA
jgi:betaine-aldehyde dehydrogenase